MLRRTLYTLLVCLLYSMMVFATDSAAYSIRQAVAEPPADRAATPKPDIKDRAKVKAGKIQKVRPIYMVQPEFVPMGLQPMESYLPVARTKGWEADAEVIFARIKGKIRLSNSNWGWGWGGWGYSPDQDLNGDWGIPEHGAVGSFSLSYKFRPKWSLRYSIMPMELNGSGGSGQNYWYGGYGQGTQVKWQRLYHRAGLVYDPILTYRARVGVFADYVRLDEKLSFGGTAWSGWGSGASFDHQLNMGMAGLEFDRCLKIARFSETLSLECRAGVAFLDEAVGSDIMAGLKYTIPMGKGRWGSLGGGYRYVNFKKGYNEFKQIDTSVEGGYLKMAFMF
jgi:hypothetical protein